MEFMATSPLKRSRGTPTGDGTETQDITPMIIMDNNRYGVNTSPDKRSKSYNEQHNQHLNSVRNFRHLPVE